MKKTSEAVPTRDSEESSEGPNSDPSDDAAALTFVRPIAIVAVLVVLLGRALGTSFRGLAVGLGKHAERLELVGSTLSQGFLILGTIVSLGLVLAILRASVSGFVRFAVVACGGLVTLATLLSMATRTPDGTLLISASLASALALVAAWNTIRIPFARAASLVVGGVALGAVARVVAIVLLTRDQVPNGYRLAAQSFSTAGLVLDGLAMAVAVGFVSSRNRKPSSPATIIALGAALIATRLALGGVADDAGSLSILFDRASRALLMRPEPLVSKAVATFFAFAAPALAIAVLATPTLTPALSGAIALVLLAHGSPDVPLCALMMVIAAVATILAARDHRGIWAAIKRDEVGVQATDAGQDRQATPASKE
ncbi:MAG TPA: hypothetical protein PKA58_17640 [Polyangium sp.]|nr:hypothetical protein [Polyangium sp.]